MQKNLDHNQPLSRDRSSYRRITIAAARRILGMVSRNYSDEDVSEILDALYGMAEESFKVYTNNAHEPDD